MNLSALYWDVTGRSDVFLWPERPKTSTRQNVQAGQSRRPLTTNSSTEQCHCSRAAGTRFEMSGLIEQVALGSNAGFQPSRKAVVHVSESVMLHLTKGAGDGSAKRLQTSLIVQLRMLRQHCCEHSIVEHRQVRTAWWLEHDVKLLVLFGRGAGEPSSSNAMGSCPF